MRRNSEPILFSAVFRGGERVAESPFHLALVNRVTIALICQIQLLDITNIYGNVEIVQIALSLSLKIESIYPCTTCLRMNNGYQSF